MRRFFFSMATALLCTAVHAQPLAFPGAEGYGKHAAGGRGGRTLVVTNLNDDGPGSLRWAVEQHGPRTVVFAVSGNIELQSPLRVNNDSITIAGQTAPGDGICLKDQPLVVNGSHVIIRYLRVRLGDKFVHDNDAVSGGRYGQHDVILDHLSCSYSIDECLSIYKTRNLTVQWCLVSHSLAHSRHTKGAHGFGGIWGGYGATFHHNLLANHSSRNPRFSSVEGTKQVDFRNNVVYNWGFKSAYGGGRYGEINMVANYYKPGPASQHHRLLDVADDGTGRYYVQGNVMVGDKAVTQDNWAGVGGKNDPLACRVDEPYPFVPIDEQRPERAYQLVLQCVGCSHRRDSYDCSIVEQVEKGEASFGNKGIIDTPEQAGGWPVLKSSKAPQDTDQDGMPDAWELKHGLNPKDAADATQYSLDKAYTNLEVYINELLELAIPDEIAPIVAPFDMPQLQRPVFPDYQLLISKTGAKQGKLSTKAIQKAIDKVAAKGGGTVVVPQGQWLTGRLTLKTGVNLHIEKDAELCFSGDIKDYLPVVACRNEGVDVYSMGAMIYADGAENIAVTGEGRLVAPSRDCELMQRAMGGVSEALQQMKVEERIYDGANGGEVCLPVFIGPMNCKNVLIEGVTLVKSLFWNIVPCYCENIIIRGVTVNSHGLGRTDGIDIDSSVNTLIEYTTLDCGDDCFTLKSGRGMDGVRRARPTENVVVRHCLAKRGVGGMTFGSETAAGIRNVYVHDLTIDGAKRGLYFKTRRPRGGGGDHLYFERIHMKTIEQHAVNFDMLGSATYVGNLASRHPAPEINELTPSYHDIHFKDIRVDKCQTLIKAVGLPESLIENVSFEGLRSENKTIELQDVGTMTFNDKN